jgi:hypothetical protein
MIEQVALCLPRDRLIAGGVIGKFHSSGECDVMRGKNKRLFELARVLVRLDHVACIIVNPNHGIM